MDALVRLLRGELDFAGFPDEVLWLLGEVARDSRYIRHRTVVELHRRQVSFEAMGGRWNVHQATVSRWAREPTSRRPGERPLPT